MRFKTVLIVLACSVATASCGIWETMMGAKEAVPVTTELAKVVERTETIRTPAKFESGKRAVVSIPQDGVLDRIYVDVGEAVTKDQPIFKIREENTLIEMGQLRANQREFETELDKLEYTLRNRDQLLDEGKIDNEKYDGIEEEVRKKEGELEGVRLKISALEKRQTESLYRSPITGIVENVTRAVPGSVVAKGVQVVTVVATNPMTATFQLSPDEVAAIKPGMPVTLKLLAFANTKVGGVIKSIGNEMDPTTRTFDVSCIVPNDDGSIKEGVAAEVEIVSTKKMRFFSVSKEALLSDRRRHYVFVVENGVAHKTPVKIHKLDDETVELSSGVAEDDVIIVKGNDKVNEGTIVEVWGNR